MQVTNSLVVPILACEEDPRFPKSINMDEVETYSQCSFQELFDQAVAHHVPEYTIALVQDSDGRFKIYDGRHWCAQQNLHDSVEPSSPLADPTTRRIIKKIYIYSIPCFKLKKGIVYKSKLKNATFQLFFDKTENSNKIYNNKLNKIAEIGVNYEATIKDIATAQYLVGRALKDLRRPNEAVIWFWCAAFRGHAQAPESLMHLKAEITESL